MRCSRCICISLSVLVLNCSSDKPKGGAQPSNTNDAGNNNSTSTQTNTGTGIDTGISPFPIDGGPPLPGQPCNGRDTYCSMRYDELCQAATHDSAANSANFWQMPAQDTSIRAQLDGGIRALMLSVYDFGNVTTVCRLNCSQGSSPLSAVLGSVKEFLDANPREVVTLLIDAALGASRIESDVVAKGLDSIAYAKAASAPWPTLQDMIRSGRRLVVFANTPDAGPAWLLPRQSLIWETGSNWPSLVAMNCNPVIGNSSMPLYIVHHNLVEGFDAGSGPEPSVALASEANAFAVVTRRLQFCDAQYNRAPNFVAVDFASEGDVVGGTQVMNGVRAAP